MEIVDLPMKHGHFPEFFCMFTRPGQVFMSRINHFYHLPSSARDLAFVADVAGPWLPWVQAESQSGFGSPESPKVYLMGMGEIL